jgi:hypothetical protein
MKHSKLLLEHLKEETDFLIQKYPEYIKALWITTPEEILSNDDLTFAILIDDGKTKKHIIGAIQKTAKQKEFEIFSKSKVKIHSDIRKLSEYFELVMAGDLDTFREMNVSIPIYDPSGFFSPLQAIVKKGEIPGTASTLRNLELSVNKRFKELEKLKIQIVTDLADAAINSGQAPIVAAKKPVPNPRVVPGELNAYFVKKKMLEIMYPQRIALLYQSFKTLEHGSKKEISGKELDKLFKYAQGIHDRMEELVAQVVRKSHDNKT